MSRLLLATLFCMFFLSGQAQLFRDQVEVILDLQYLSNLQIADLDGDGDNDIIGSREGYCGNFVTYFNLDGQGNYGPPIAFGDTSWWNLTNVELHFDLGDMDNDGDLDLVPGRFAEGNIPYYVNDGNGSFSLPDVAITTGDDVSDSHHFEVADLDNNGQLDVVVFRIGVKDLYYNRIDGDGPYYTETLVHETDLQLGGLYINDFLLFDFDQDGDLDYALLGQKIASDNEGGFLKTVYLYVYEQTCTLCFEEKLELYIDQSSYIARGKELEAADFNQDGYPELLVHYSTSPLDTDERDHLLILGNPGGSGDYYAVSEILDVSSYAVTDFDQDDDLDLFLAISSDESANSGSDQYYNWHENEGSTYSFTEHLISEDYSGDAVFAADLNQDDVPDLISLRDGYPGSFGVREGQADQSFLDFRALDLPVQFIHSIAYEDWNNDEAQDILFFATLHINGAGRDGIYRATNMGDGQYSHPALVYSTQVSSLYNDFVDINNDGRLDALGVDHTTGSVVNRTLIYTLQQADGSWSDGIEVSPDLPITPNEYSVTDWDNDGDPDILVTGYEGELFLLRNEFNTIGIFVPILLDLSFIHINGYFYQLSPEDFNLDGTADILLFNNRKFLYAQSLSPEPEYAAWDTISQPEDITFFSYHIADFTADGHHDIFALGRNAANYYFLALARFDAPTGSFSPFKLVSNDVYNNSLYYSLADFNNDGAMDYLSGNGFHLNQGNGSLFTDGYLPPPLENSLNQEFIFNAIQVDTDGDEQTEIVSGFRSMVAYDYEFLNRSTLNGLIKWDTTAMCQTDSLLPVLANWPVSVVGPTQDQIAISNTDGRFATILPEVGSHQVQVLPPSGYWAVCPADTLLSVVDSSSTFQLDFSAEALVDCPLVVIDMNSTSVSQCFSSAVSISYHNAGTAPADEALIQLQYDPRLDPISSTPPWSSMTDSTLIYELGTIAVGERGLISIHFDPNCGDLIIGEEICFDATVTPNELCEDMLSSWDGASLEAEVLCEAGEVSYRIFNTGEGAMSEPVSYMVSIVNDDIILYLTGNVLLGLGESEIIPLPASDGTWHLRVDQAVGHPYPAPISLLATDCDNNNSEANLTNLLTNGNGNPFAVSLCRTVVGPYDPNDKTAIPFGLGDEHYIERDWTISYTIQFQNIGTDRARNVILQDSLSALLDLASFEPGPASHPYEWRILDNRQLMVTFTDINLPDSTSNPVESQGFFSFSIQPKADAPFETVIENYADIYFDFNAPIRTPAVSHRIRKPVHGGASQLSLCPGDNYLGIAIHQDTILEERFIYSEYDSVHWFHISVYPSQVTEIVVSLDEPGWWEGIYIAQDTTIAEVLTDLMGCDSTILYQLQLLTSTEQLALEQSIQLHPNPANDFSWLNWQGQPTPDLVIVYNQLGQQLGQYKPALGSNQYCMDTGDLPAGSYRIVLQWADKKASKTWQVVDR